MPESLENKTIAESAIRQATECSVVAVTTNGTSVINPTPDYRLPAGGELMLIGTVDAENRFLALHANR